MKGLLRQLKGQGAGGVFPFTGLFVCMLVLRRWLLRGSDCLDNVPEDGLGAICNRVATVCKVLQNRETTETAQQIVVTFTAVLFVKEKLSHSPPSW